jgi:hypothetical protein
MDRRLSKLIDDYQRRVAEAITLLEQAGIRRPVTNIEWEAMDVPGGGSLANGFTYFKHGFGCAVGGPTWGVDFDFGDEGQIDGVDAGRLYFFARKRLPDYGFDSEEDIWLAVKEAADAGELRFSGNILYYVTESGRRAMLGDAG